jgi:hypothetical protein
MASAIASATNMTWANPSRSLFFLALSKAVDSAAFSVLSKFLTKKSKQFHCLMSMVEKKRKHLRFCFLLSDWEDLFNLPLGNATLRAVVAF